MLRKLAIQHYAIIDQLEIDFSKKLNIITGETGAGKSILMGALNLILGERADTSVLQPTKKCIVEGYFEVSNDDIEHFFTQNDFDRSEEIVLRREISANGKSRMFINDTPVSLSQVKELSILLVDLHQQFDTLELNDEHFQRKVIDALAENSALLIELKEIFTKYSSAKKELNDLQKIQADANKEYDYNKFLFDELEELHLKPDELETLEGELKLLSNAENIKQQLNSATFILKESDEPVVQQLKIVSQKLSGVSVVHSGIAELNERIKSSLIEISDIADELGIMEHNTGLDADRIESINERLSSGYRLLKKHSVQTTGELLEVQHKLEEKVNQISDIARNIIKLQDETTMLESKAKTLAEKISLRRNKQLKPFTDKVNGLLKQVGMPNAQMKVEITAGVLSVFGSDDISFLFDANKSGRFESIKKVASGGELSRLMLVIKSLVATKLELPTLIFDEIDTGISGEAAKQVGLIMKELSGRHQLISITHQPQIAAKADAHYFVYKAIAGDRIVTSVKLLNNDERILSIAKMLSGEQPTAAAIENAREMVRN